MNEEKIVNEYLALGKLDLALEEAKKSGLEELSNKIEASLLKNRDDYFNHYAKANNRIPGAQIKAGWGLDSRQSCAFEHVKELSSDNLLDIGCADGSFIFNCLYKNIIKMGVGVDVWKEGILWAKNFGDTSFPSQTLFFQGLFEEYSDYSRTDIGYLKDFTTKKEVTLYSALPPFTAIHIGEVLEHVLDPIAILKKAKTLLHPTGGIVITVPVKRPPLTQQEKNILISGDVNEHIRYIDISALKVYASECGLKIAKEQYEGSHWVNLIVTLKHS